MILTTTIISNLKWKIFSCVIFLALIGQKTIAQTTVNFNFTNSVQTFVVPPCVFSLDVTAAGAKGGGANGGNGAQISATINVNPGDVLNIYVGGAGGLGAGSGGWNGGGNGHGASNATWFSGGGGGASDIRIGGITLNNRVIVAGGGGGRGGGSDLNAGGAANCNNGAAGTASFGAGGGGGTQAGGGAGAGWGGGTPGASGVLGNGGQGGLDNCFNVAPGGGGGGGYYGGGGGGADCWSSTPHGGGGGGGGSSLVPTGGTCVPNTNTGNGWLTITYMESAGTTTASSTGPYCVGDMIQLNGQAGADTYSWTGPNGFVSNDQNPTIPNSTLANAGTYTLTATTGGCVANDDVTVVVNPLPIFSVINSSDPSGCATSDGTITLGVLDPNESYTVSHTGGAGVGMNSDGAGNIIISGLGAGNYTDFIVDFNGCDSEVNTVIELIEPNGPVVIAGLDITICSGDEITLTAGNPDGAAISWDNGVNDGVPFTPPVGTTVYTVTGNLLNCIGTDQITIIADPLPTIDAGTDFVICEGEETTLTANNPDGASISWDNGINDGVPFTPPSGGETYTVTADLNGCINTDFVVVSVSPNPTFTLSSIDPSGCNLLDGSITISGLIPGEEYNISHSGGVSVSMIADAGGEVIISGLGSGSYTDFDVELDNCSTLDASTIVLVDPNPPTVGAGLDQSICIGDEVTLVADNPDGATISWDNGVNDGVAFTPPLGTTTYTVTATDALGCESNDQVQIIVNDLPLVDAGADIEICEGVEITLSGNGNAVNYSWDNGINDGVSFTPSLGTTIYTVTGVSADGCENMDQVTVIINPSPTVNAGVDQSVCAGEEVTLTASGNANNYSWDNGVNDGVGFIPGATMTYTVTGTDVNGCSATDEVTVTVNPLPTINAGTDLIICEGEEITLSASGTSTSYVWDNGVVDGAPFVPGEGVVSYTVTGTDANGCSNTASVLVTVLPQPIASFTATPQTGMPPLEVIFTNNSSNGTVYTWNFGNGDQDISNTPDDFIVTYTETGTYTVVLTVDNGVCSNSQTVTIVVENLPLVFNLPNIFTPNGDGSNDLLHFNLQNAESVYVEIVNRWGNLVGIIDSIDPQDGWDGNDHKSGTPVSEGVYFYTYTFVGIDGETTSGHHFVHLNR